MESAYGRGPPFATRCRKPDKGNYGTLDAFDQYELKFQNNILGSEGVLTQPVAIWVLRKSWGMALQLGKSNLIL